MSGNKNLPVRPGTLIGGLLALLLAGGAFGQDSVEFLDVAEIAATVEAIDVDNRLVTLRGPQGNEVTVEAGPEVRNLAQIEAGDVVRLNYQLYYRATRVEPADLTHFAGVGIDAVRAAEGERPAAAIGMAESVVVAIESIGPDGRTATFITPDGALQAIFVRREEGRAFARSLAPGDLVELTVGEAIAVVVEPLSE
jgi:hypothetical protein